jgi:quercetin dioxygenase-like cupin family protein
MTSAAVSPAQARAIRRRLLDRVADTDDSHVTIPPGRGGWQPFGDGVQIKVLNEHGGILSYLLKLEPGAVLQAHRHPADEECLVLEGVLKVGSRTEVGAGGYHLARAGSLHARISTDTGATIFLRGAEPHVDQLLV